jgi:hypothetical protein
MKKKELEGLEGFLQNTYYSNYLTKEEAKKNIEEGLVEIHEKGHIKTNSKGFQITHDGYILTSAHCVEQKAHTEIISREGRVYQLEKMCAVDEKSDVALIKANIEGENKPRIYPLYTSTKNQAIQCIYLCLKDNLVTTRGCVSDQIYTNNLLAYNNKHELQSKNQQIILSGVAKSGDSGSPILTCDAQLIGILATSDNKNTISGTHINAALDLITKYIHMYY